MLGNERLGGKKIRLNFRASSNEVSHLFLGGVNQKNKGKKTLPFSNPSHCLHLTYVLRPSSILRW